MEKNNQINAYDVSHSLDTNLHSLLLKSSLVIQSPCTSLVLSQFSLPKSLNNPITRERGRWRAVDVGQKDYIVDVWSRASSKEVEWAKFLPYPDGGHSSWHASSRCFVRVVHGLNPERGWAQWHVDMLVHMILCWWSTVRIPGHGWLQWLTC